MPQLLPTCRLCVNLTGIRCKLFGIGRCQLASSASMHSRAGLYGTAESSVHHVKRKCADLTRTPHPLPLSTLINSDPLRAWRDMFITDLIENSPKWKCQCQPYAQNGRDTVSFFRLVETFRASHRGEVVGTAPGDRARRASRSWSIRGKRPSPSVRSKLQRSQFRSG
jgi:hypothetical protein